MVTKSRPAPLEEKPKVPPKPIRKLLSNQGIKSSGGSNLTLKPTVKKPKIKSPAFNSPKRFVIPVKKDDIAIGVLVSGVLRDQKSPAAFKNPIRGDNSLKRKSSLSKDSSARVGIQINARQKTDSSLKANNTSKPTKDVSRKSLATSSIQRDRFPSEQRINNNKTDVAKRTPSLASQPRTRTVPSKSPAFLSSPQPSSARLASSASSVSLQSRRKSVGEMMRKSPLTSSKPTPGPGPAGPSSSSHASTLPRIATQQRRSLSQRGSVSWLQSSQSRKESNQVLGLTF